MRPVNRLWPTSPRLVGGLSWIRNTSSGKQIVFMPIDEGVADDLLAIAKIGPFVFWNGRLSNNGYLHNCKK